jgi:hypothetical protein
MPRCKAAFLCSIKHPGGRTGRNEEAPTFLEEGGSRLPALLLIQLRAATSIGSMIVNLSINKLQQTRHLDGIKELLSRVMRHQMVAEVQNRCLIRD